MKTMHPALRSFAVLTAITGIIYPLLITGIAQLAFSRQANGSLVTGPNGHVIGSEWLAQEFTSPRYFWPRPSATSFATVPSGASNLGPSSHALQEAIASRATALRNAHHLPEDAPVPDELVQASGSGLDPQISASAARFQLKRVCAARGIDEARVSSLIGSKLVNVFALNRQLDAMEAGSTR
jgi:K+-transporting ATPase ATPase C chain